MAPSLVFLHCSPLISIANALRNPPLCHVNGATVILGSQIAYTYHISRQLSPRMLLVAARPLFRHQDKLCTHSVAIRDLTTGNYVQCTKCSGSACVRLARTTWRLVAGTLFWGNFRARWPYYGGATRGILMSSYLIIRAAWVSE